MKYTTQHTAKTLLSSLIIFFILQVVFTAKSHAEEFKHYISDQLVINLRAEPSSKSKAIMRVVSGQDVYLEEDANGWARIRVGNKKGWIRSRYLINRPVAKVIAEQLRKKNLTLIKQLNNLRDEVQQTKSRSDSSSKELVELENTNFKLSKDLEYLKSITGKEVELQEENSKLKSTVAELKAGIEKFSNKIDDVESNQNRKWFLAGAGIIVVGILLGRFLSPPSFKRRHLNSI